MISTVKLFQCTLLSAHVHTLGTTDRHNMCIKNVFVFDELVNNFILNCSTIALMLKNAIKGIIENKT